MSLASVEEDQKKQRRPFVDPKAAILHGIRNTIQEGQNLLRGVLRVQSTIHTGAAPRILLHEVLAESQRQET
jgi:hypothetical protein